MKEIDLLRYLPQIEKEIKEMNYLAQAENPELSAVLQGIQHVLQDQFVQEATENGLGRWESILKIVPKGTDTLDERRFRILVRLNEELPYTFRMLCQQLEHLCGESGYTVNLKAADYTLEVKVHLEAKSNFNDVKNMLDRITPANLVVNLSLRYLRVKDVHGMAISELCSHKIEDFLFGKETKHGI